MNETHKGHNIVISASRSGDTRQWKPHVKIIWSEDGGLIFAKKWIDDGKPDR